MPASRGGDVEPGAYDPAVTSRTTGNRERADLCPGALNVHEAADGGLLRVRLPGGTVTGAQWGALAAAAADLGDGRLELTSRGNLQIRALPSGAETELAELLVAVGLLPSATHERVRNIVASPLSGIDGRGIDGTDVTGLAAALDHGLCARPRLAQLPGRFLFAVDDGRGDVARLGADVTLIAGGGRTLVGPLDVASGDAVTVALALAEAFLTERVAQGSKAWRIDELAGGPQAVALRALRGLAGVDAHVSAIPSLPSAPARPAGVICQPDGRSALTVVAPLGRLTADQAQLIGAHARPRGLRVTPWRSVVLPDLPGGAATAAAAAAAGAGLGIDTDSRWYGLSACTGRPGCAKALSDVQSDARAAGRWPGRKVHWSGCGRRCGRPYDTEVDVVATAEGYRTSE